MNTSTVVTLAVVGALLYFFLKRSPAQTVDNLRATPLTPSQTADFISRFQNISCPAGQVRGSDFIGNPICTQPGVMS